jgi:hypothetical protein
MNCKELSSVDRMPIGEVMAFLDKGIVSEKMSHGLQAWLDSKCD